MEYAMGHLACKVSTFSSNLFKQDGEKAKKLDTVLANLAGRHRLLMTLYELFRHGKLNESSLKDRSVFHGPFSIRCGIMRSERTSKRSV
jgi:hypothetical protein